MTKKDNKKGFTIIEVVLVLAIAGLIFAMVFIALPALKRSQRDQSRKNDASVVASAINNWNSANRNGGTFSEDSLRKYVEKLDQYDKNSELKVATPGASMSVAGNEIKVMRGKKCPSSTPAPSAGDPANITLQNGSSRNAAVVVLLENNGSQKQLYCQDV
ncbi:type II secretion system protein [Candidatus Nanosynbacter sp. TM7-053]|uniref:type II secretion system protein n=1 Tax=Candidatus Nanosynbacter sp. TM7-053 TaxID=2902634 RepID=UPI001FB6E02B|nr:type II secretion system protein [Candidatus Nanosynbacter sp. TM7-053]MCJ1965582.1 type II secretion system GspH family protein [Candidatus Nanosynbacter sp. TM7-053]